MKKIFLIMLLLIIGGSAIAGGHIKCNGSDTAGNSIYLIAYENATTVNINGDILNIIGKTNNGQGVVTQNFLSVAGILVYNSIVPINNSSLTIYQFNAVNQRLLAQAWLSCSFYGYTSSAPKLIDHQAFSSIKSAFLKSPNGNPYSKIKNSEDTTDHQSNSALTSPVDVCIAKVEKSINSAKDQLSAAGLLCSSTGIDMIVCV